VRDSVVHPIDKVYELSDDRVDLFRAVFVFLEESLSEIDVAAKAALEPL